MPGYPDFQTSSQWRADPVLDLAATAITTLPGESSFGPFSLQNYAYLTVVGRFITHNGRVRLLTSDTGASALPQSATFAAFAGQYFGFQIPVMFASVSLLLGGSAANTTADIYLAPTNIPILPPPNIVDGVLNFSTSGAIASLGVYDVRLPPYSGPATVTVDASQTSFVTRIAGRTYDDTTDFSHPLAKQETAATLVTYDVWLGPFINHLRVGNTAGTNSTYTVSVTTKGYFGQP